jgi:hypothetical protein
VVGLDDRGPASLTFKDAFKESRICLSALASKGKLRSVISRSRDEILGRCSRKGNGKW